MRLTFCSTDVTKRVWRSVTFPQTVTPRQELCIAQLNNRRAKSHWHSFERASKRSSESGRAESTRANNPLCPPTPQLSRSTSPPGTRDTRATAGSKVRTTTGLSRVTCQGWNPSARAGQFPPPFSFSSSALLALSGYRCVTLPLWSHHWTHRAQQRLAHMLKELLAQSVSAHCHIISRRLCEGDGGAHSWAWDILSFRMTRQTAI